MAEKDLEFEKQIIEDLRDEKKAHAAFDRMMRAYGEQIYWQIRRMVLNHDDANDLLQNVFVKAWTGVKHFRGDARLLTWLYKIAVNESINFLNKEKQRRAQKPENEEEAAFLMDRLEADTYFDGDAAQKKLMEAIASLPEKQRLVFNMRYFDEMKYEQISDILGTSVGALKASYHHAAKKIESALLNDD